MKTYIKKINTTEMETELINIGYDGSYAFKGKDKFEYLNLKIFNITSAQGNIIKQLALSVGADCATHRDVITGKIEQSDCILGGNIAQLTTISSKLQLQPFGLKNLGKDIEEIISFQKNNSSGRTKIVGILNVTKDSFSDGGQYYNTEDAIKHLNKLIKDGADIIDIGAESTRPNALPVEPEEQLRCIIPVLNYVRDNKITVPISIDTRSSLVAQECIKSGANIINDVSGFDYDENLADVIAQNPEVRVIIQHSQGTPETMQINPQYNNLMDEIFMSLKNKIDYALSKGIKKENIIIDAGIGFGKTREQNFEIINKWQELKTLGCPIMLGVSRKSLLNMPQASNDEKDLYTLALDGILMKEKIDYIRVHNVKIHKEFQRMFI